MRVFFFAVCASVSLFAIVLAGPRFIADTGNLIGDEAVQLAIHGDALNKFSYERAVRSRERALYFYAKATNQSELGLLHFNQLFLADRGAAEQFGRAPEFAALSREAFSRALSINPVQPSVWAFVSQLHLRDEEREAASEALAWSFRTGYFHRPLLERRILLAFELWDEISPVVKQQLEVSIIELARRQPRELVEIAFAAGLGDEVMDIVSAHEPDGPLLAARFYRAVGQYFGAESRFLGQLGDRAAMQRLLASAGLMITIALPVPSFAMTIEEYLAVNRGEAATYTQSDVIRYLTGVLDATVMTGEVARMQGTPVFCISEEQILTLEPGEVKVTLDLMLDEFEREMPNFRELARSRTIGIATLQLFMYLYPCEETSLAN